VTLRARLTAAAVLGSAIVLAVLVLAFNLVLDGRLGADGENVLRERAATALRGLGTIDGHLSLIEAPDQGAVDAQTWIFSGERELEHPAGADPRNQLAAVALARSGVGFSTVNATDTRLFAVQARRGGRALGVVVVAASLAPYESTASAALVGSLALAAVILIAIAALSRWLIGRSLRPVASMTARAAGWEERDLSRRFFAGEPRDELTALAAVFDGLLGRLRQALMRERRLTAEVSHELRTPLSKIVAEAELASARERPAPELRTSLESIARHARELQRVLETLLAAARESSPAASCDACAAGRQTLDALRHTAGASAKRLELICPTPARAAVEPDLLTRILAPLLENAARHATTSVTLEIGSADGEILLAVHDDGAGVAADDRERIFEAGVRLDAALDAERGGAGLGLALVRRLARSAGGEVTARPAPRGASFVVRLPAA
jgi:signal transduction histidine kinase